MVEAGNEAIENDEAAWRHRVAAARRRGDHLATYDAATAGMAALPDSLPLHHAAILALARSGATRGARERLDRLAATGRLAGIADPSLSLDFAALDGRLHKDAWARSEGAAALAHAARSGESYATAFRRHGHYYPAVNAATMLLTAGRRDEALPLARAALALAREAAPDHWSRATIAEAALILGDPATARAGLDQATRLGLAGLDDIAATRRQIAWVVRLTKADPRLLDALPVPPVVYWLDDEATLAGEALPAESRPRSIAFGALIDPIDVERALRLLDRGAEVNLVLPCEPPAWRDSLGPARGATMGPRLDDVLARAANVMAVTREGDPREPAALHLCRRQARGLALLRAESFVSTAARLVWGRGSAGTPVLHPDAPEIEPGPEQDGPDRLVRAILFADIRGFSRLPETAQLLVLDRVVGDFADVLASCGGVDYAATAGDGLYVVLSDIAAAVRCCFALRAAMTPARVAELGLPAEIGLRMSAHVGPVYRRFDPVIRRDNFHGSEVIRAARIEPVTPVGEIYVTEQFAAALAADGSHDTVCDYVGRQPMAKGFGECRMYALRRAKM